MKRLVQVDHPLVKCQLSIVRDKRTELENDPSYVEKVLRDGAERAGAEIQQTLDMVRDAVGLGASKLVRR